MSTTIRNILNKIRWSPYEDKDSVVIIYLHRNHKPGQREVNFALIEKIGKSWFTYKRDSEEVLIPYHRILEIRDEKKGKILWRKRS